MNRREVNLQVLPYIKALHSLIHNSPIRLWMWHKILLRVRFAKRNSPLHNSSSRMRSKHLPIGIKSVFCIQRPNGPSTVWLDQRLLKRMIGVNE